MAGLVPAKNSMFSLRALRLCVKQSQCITHRVYHLTLTAPSGQTSTHFMHRVHRESHRGVMLQIWGSEGSSSSASRVWCKRNIAGSQICMHLQHSLGSTFPPRARGLPPRCDRKTVERRNITTRRAETRAALQDPTPYLRQGDGSLAILAS